MPTWLVGGHAAVAQLVVEGLGAHLPVVGIVAVALAVPA